MKIVIKHGILSRRQVRALRSARPDVTEIRAARMDKPFKYLLPESAPDEAERRELLKLKSAFEDLLRRPQSPSGLFKRVLRHLFSRST